MRLSPKSPEHGERRKFSRIDFSNGVELITGKEKKTLKPRDLSWGGMSFYSDDRTLDPKDEVLLKFYPPNRFIDDGFDLSVKIPAKVIGKRLDQNAKEYLAVKFDNDLKTTSKQIYRSRRKYGYLILPILILSLIWLKSSNYNYFWYQPLNNLYSLIVTLYITSRFFVSMFYRPPSNAHIHPSITFVIPVYNDQNVIRKTINACFGSHYPEDKIEVIVINDGSTDHTLSEIKKSQQKYSHLKLINFERNQGKRHAMAAGAKEASGEIIVYIDSDSIIRRNSLYYLVQGFADETVGAVCGHAYVYNTQENLLTKMQEVRYYVAFRVIKAAEHVFSAVTCCSGSLSAYRKEYLLEFLDEWLNQKFLVEPATFGDDRSLTNYMLKNYRVLYDSRAGVETVVPSNWKQFFRQQLRWKKSWFRESLIASKIMWYKHPLTVIFFYAGVLLPLVSPFIVYLNFIYRPIMLEQWPVYYLLGFLLISLLYSGYYFLRRPNTKWLYGFYFCFVYISVLSWQTYYAILTSRRNHWGTR